MTERTVTCTTEGHVALVTLNPAAAEDASRMGRELADLAARLNSDDDIHVVIVTGAGNESLGSIEPGPAGDICSPAAAVAGIDRPVIAAVGGDAIGPGLEIALSCDIRLAAEGARFGLPQLAGGRLPTDGGTQRLPRIVGRAKALEMLLTGSPLSAAEALEIGLVSRVVAQQELLDEARKLAGEIASKGPIALRYLKEAVNKGMDMTLEQGLRLEADLYFLLHTTADRTEGINAFREKRTPEFKGE